MHSVSLLQRDHRGCSVLAAWRQLPAGPRSMGWCAAQSKDHPQQLHVSAAGLGCWVGRGGTLLSLGWHAVGHRLKQMVVAVSRCACNSEAGKSCSTLSTDRLNCWMETSETLCYMGSVRVQEVASRWSTICSQTLGQQPHNIQTCPSKAGPRQGTLPSKESSQAISRVALGHNSCK